MGETRSALRKLANRGHDEAAMVLVGGGEVCLMPGTEGRGFADRRPMPDHIALRSFGDMRGGMSVWPLDSLVRCGPLAPAGAGEQQERIVRRLPLHGMPRCSASRIDCAFFAA